MPHPLSPIRRRHLLQLLAGASGAAVLHACTPSSDSSSESTPASGAAMSMTMGSISWVGQVPIYIAQDKGFYEEEGLDFELRIFGAGGEYMSAFLSNQLDGVSPVS